MSETMTTDDLRALVRSALQDALALDGAGYDATTLALDRGEPEAAPRRLRSEPVERAVRLTVRGSERSVQLLEAALAEGVATVEVAIGSGVGAPSPVPRRALGVMGHRVERFSLGMPWEESHGYAQALRVGSTVHVSGQVPHDDGGQIVGLGDPGAQATRVLANLDRVLAGIGATRRQVSETWLMVVRIEDAFAAASAAHREFFGDHRPASTAFGVAGLAFPGQLIELSARVDLNLSR